MTERLECKCGGTLRKNGNQFICENCDSVYLISADDKGELFAYQSVEKKQIQTGQIAAKATAIPVNQVAVRQINLDEDIESQVARESMELDKRSRISLIEGYLSTGDWEKVDEHVNVLLLENKDCSEARWYGWMSEKKAADDRQMLSKLSGFSHADATRLDQILQYASPAFVKRVVGLFFDGAFANDSMCYHTLSVILPYARNEVIYSEAQFAEKVCAAFDNVISGTYEHAFNYLLENTLHPEDVDLYISYASRFADNCGAQTAQVYYEKVLAVDPGNLKVHRKLVQADIESDAPCQKTISDVERLISYSDAIDRDVTAFIDKLCSKQKTTANKSDVMWSLLSYHSAAPEGLKDQLLAYGHVLLESKLWIRARDFFNLVLSFDVRCGDAYWGLCLIQMEAKNDQDAINKKEPIKSFSAYDKALAVYSVTGDTKKAAYLKELSEKQKSKKENTKRALIAGAIALLVILIIFIGNKISQEKKYSAKNISLTIVNEENVQEPITEFDLQIKNGCTEDLAGIDLMLRFYDSEKELICSTTLNLSGYMASKDKKVVTVKLHDDVVEKLYWYSFDELKITIEITQLNFNEVWDDPPTKDKERVLKKNQKVDESEIKATKKKLSDALELFEATDITDSDFEAQTMEFGAALDEIWEDVIKNKSLLEMIYSDAEKYQDNTEYEKAYILFGMLAAIGYEDSEDRAYDCAMSAAY